MYLKPAINKTGIILKEEFLGLSVKQAKHYLVLVEEKLYSVPEVNLVHLELVKEET